MEAFRSFLLLACLLAPVLAQTTTPRSTTRSSGIQTGTTYRPPTSWTSSQVPNPITDRTKCNMPHAPSFVCRPHGYIISDADARSINKESEDTCDDTKCPCKTCNNLCNGFSIGTAVLDKVTGSNKPVAVDKMAEDLLLEWEFNGQCSDGRVQIVLADGDGYLSTARGKEAAKKLTDKCVTQLYNDIQADLYKNDEGRALHRLVNGYRNALRGKGCKITTAGASANSQNLAVALTVALFGLFLSKSVSL